MKSLVSSVLLAMVGVLSDTSSAVGVGSIPVIHVDVSFTEQEFRLIIKAAIEWARASDTIPPVLIQDLHKSGKGLSNYQWEHSNNAFWRMTSNDEAWMVKTIMSGSFLGLGREGAHMSVVPEDIDNESELYSVIVHEFGHYYGVGHLDHGVMQSSDIDVNCIDEAALAAYCENNNCGPYTKSTCE